MRKLSFCVLALCVSFLISAETDNSNLSWKNTLQKDDWQRKFPETVVFVRSQMKYGLEANLLNKWVDRPLFTDPSLKGEGPRKYAFYYPSFVKMQQTCKEYGLDGFAFFPETSGRIGAYEYADQSKVKDFRLLTEFLTYDDINKKIKIAELALKSPSSLKFKDKLVITSYRADSVSPEYWKKVFDELKSKYGDKFIFLPDTARFISDDLKEKYRNNSLKDKDIVSVQEQLRSYLRVSDGLYFAAAAMIKKDRKFDEKFYSDFLIRIFKSILSEPEFKNKYLALSACVGHENCTRIGYGLSCDGTKTLRHSFEAAMSANPDIINIPEWDEQNENTSLRPTVYNSLSSMRIMKYYTGKLKGKKPEVLKNDDLNIPNMIISYRKILVLGEKLEIELLNIPDSENKFTYTVHFSLKDLKGEIIADFPVQTFNASEMQDITLTFPTEKIAQQVVLPCLEIDYKGKKLTFEDGLHYVDLRTSWNWDYKWVKQPLRDLLKPLNAEFKLSSKGNDGTEIFGASIKTEEPLAYVEILDNDDVIYSFDPKNDFIWRENPEYKVISMAFQSYSEYMLNGSVSVENADAKWLLPERLTQKVSNNTLKFNKTSALRPVKILIAIPSGSVEKAIINVNMPGLYTGKIPVSKIMKNLIYAIPGPKGFNISFSRYIRQSEMPGHLNTNDVNFKVAAIPDLPFSVFHMQAIGKSGKLYRSKPVLMTHETGKKSSVAVFSSSQNCPVKINVDAARASELNYVFNPEHGSVLICDAGRPLWGILGGYVTLAIERGQDGNAFIKGGATKEPYPNNAVKSAPDWVDIGNGSYALKFDGKGTYITLPQGVIPRRAGFILTMDIKPENLTKKQILFANRAHVPGSMTVYIDKGVLRANFLNENLTGYDIDSKMQLKANEWSKINIIYDQQNLCFVVNGKKSPLFPCKGPGLYDTLTIIGGYADAWFDGLIKGLIIKHITEN